MIAELAQLLRSGRLTHRTLVDGSGVLLDTETLQVLALNEAGDLVYRAVLEGAASEEELVSRLVEDFEVDRETAAADVAVFLETLRGTISGPR